MSATASGLAGYQLHLPMFEGPLDVLLQMIERDRLEISEVSLVAITGGFIEYIASMVDPDPAMLAQFLGVASRLLLLKSRALLPRRAVEEPDEEADDLVAQLREYQHAKNVAMLFREREIAGLRSHPRTFMPAKGTVNVIVIAPPIGQLRRALLRAAARLRQEPEVRQLRLQVSISEMIDRFRREIATFRTIGFQVFLGPASRDETVAGFVALLALWRQDEIVVRQDHHFEEIWIEWTPNGRRPS